MNAELIKGMNDKEYFAIDALNASTLKAMNNPMVYKYNQGHKASSDAMKIGTDFHELLLRGVKPEDAKNVAISDFDSFRSNDAKAWKAEQEAAGKTILKRYEIESYTADLFEMQETILELDGISEYFNQSWNEVVILWDRVTANGSTIKCKAKIDAYRERHPLLIDIKTTGKLDKFDSNIFNFGGYIQAAWYLEAVKELDGIDRTFQFAVVSTEKPYQSALRELELACIAQGYDEIRDLIEVYVNCRSTGIWESAYPNKAETIVTPGWFAAKINSALELEA